MSTPLILLADDEPHITHVVSAKLRAAGYDVEVAHDGERALAMARERVPSLIVTDLQMPYMSGIELARALMEHDATRSVPVLMLTARGYVLGQEGTAVTNIRAVLSKPFSARDVLARVEGLLQGAAGSDAQHRSAA